MHMHMSGCYMHMHMYGCCMHMHMYGPCMHMHLFGACATFICLVHSCMVRVDGVVRGSVSGGRGLAVRRGSAMLRFVCRCCVLVDWCVCVRACVCVRVRMGGYI